MEPTAGHYLYPFLLRDKLSGRWYRARWTATAEDIEERGGTIDGPGQWITPLEAHHDPRMAPLPRPLPGDVVGLDPQESMGVMEVMLVRVFLRRYATWCARTRRYAAMQSAKALYLELT